MDCDGVPVCDAVSVRLLVCDCVVLGEDVSDGVDVELDVPVALGVSVGDGDDDGDGVAVEDGDCDIDLL